MTTSTQQNMAPFLFPDPAVQSSVVNPNTGDVWIYADGVWMIADPNNPQGPIQPGQPADLQTTIAQLQQEIQTLRTDIINLEAQLASATVNNFLILE